MVMAALSMPALAQTSAFSIDGVAYPRSMVDRRVQQSLESSGRSLQAIRHPAALRKYQREALDRIVDELLLAREAAVRGLRPDLTATPDRAGNSTRTGSGAMPPWADESVRMGLLGALTQQLADELQPDDAAIAGALQNGTRPQLPERVRASHILLALPPRHTAGEYETAAATARELIARSAAGTPFAELARTYSTDSSAAAGGDLGWFARGQMVPEFEQAAFSAAPGQVVGPVRSLFGLHIIKVAAHQPARAATDAEWREQLRAQQRVELLRARLQTLIDELRTRAEIIVNMHLN